MIYCETDGFSKGEFASFRQMAFNFAQNRLWFSSITFLELKKPQSFAGAPYQAGILVNGLRFFAVSKVLVFLENSNEISISSSKRF